MMDGTFLGTSDEKIEHKVFHCSDGSSFHRFRKAYKHEMYIRIPSFFPESAIVNTFYIGKPDLFYFSKHMALKCGVYRIVMNCQMDLTVVNHFFKGVKEYLDYPSDDSFPIELDLEIFYEKVPGVIVDTAQWRIYKGGDHR